MSPAERAATGSIFPCRSTQTNRRKGSGAIPPGANTNVPFFDTGTDRHPELAQPAGIFVACITPFKNRHRVASELKLIGIKGSGHQRSLLVETGDVRVGTYRPSRPDSTTTCRSPVSSESTSICPPAAQVAVRATVEEHGAPARQDLWHPVARTRGPDRGRSRFSSWPPSAATVCRPLRWVPMKMLSSGLQPPPMKGYGPEGSR